MQGVRNEEEAASITGHFKGDWTLLFDSLVHKKFVVAGKAKSNKRGKLQNMVGWFGLSRHSRRRK